MHLQTKRSRLVVITAIALLFCAAPHAGADEGRRVVVAEFEGPEPSSRLVRQAVAQIIADYYEVLPLSRFRLARRRLNLSQDSMKSYAQVARKVGADAIVEGVIKGHQLTISVREGKTGRVVDRFSIKVQDRGVSESAREGIVDELVDLIDWTEPLNGEPEAGGVGADRAQPATGSEGEAGPPRASLAAAEKKPEAVAEKWSVAKAKARAEAKPKPKPRPPAIQVRTSVGLAATARQLQFASQSTLGETQRPLNMSGSPTGGVALAGTFDLNPLGVSADVLYTRSIGASVSFPAGGMTKELSISLSHFAGRLMVHHGVGHQITLQGGAGYHQLSSSISNRPNGLLIPDTRYAYADIGGGAKLGLRDDRISLSAGVWYLHLLSTGGITAPTTFGSASSQGFAADLGLDIDAGDSTFVHLGATYQRIVLSFNGDGAWASGLDDSTDLDVSGASDQYVGAVVMLGFRL
jgi:hypothetical protein